MSDPIPVRLAPELLEPVRQAAAEDDDRSIAAWIRCAMNTHPRTEFALYGLGSTPTASAERPMLFG